MLSLSSARNLAGSLKLEFLKGSHSSLIFMPYMGVPIISKATLPTFIPNAP